MFHGRLFRGKLSADTSSTGCSLSTINATNLEGLEHT
jgi:hypothetical protein